MALLANIEPNGATSYRDFEVKDMRLKSAHVLNDLNFPKHWIGKVARKCGTYREPILK